MYTLDLAEEKTELERWRERLNATGLPVFAKTVREVSHVANSRASSATDLSAVVGRDASMSAKLIQIANSPLFNLQNRAINTIDEAVVLVGFDAIRDLAISVSVLEELHNGHQDEHCATLMARAFHAAAHSQFISRASHGDGGEDVFVGALLKDVGPMAFWSRGGDQAQTLHAALQQWGHPEQTAQVERDCLGFELSELSLALAADWRLGDLVEEVLKGRSDVAGVEAVLEGHSLAEQIEEQGLEAPQVRERLQALARRLDLSVSEVTEAVERSVKAAEDLIGHLGISVSTHKPGPDQQKPSTGSQPASPPDSAEILQVLQEIALAIEQGRGRDVLMQQVVDAVHAQLRFAGAAFALFTPDRSQLVVKFQAGCALFEQTILDPAQLLLDASAPDAGKVISQTDESGTRHSVCIRINNKPVGILFGQVVVDGTSTDQYVTAFRQMAQQLTLILTASHRSDYGVPSLTSLP